MIAAIIMGKKQTMTFQEAVAKLDSFVLKTSLSVNKTAPCGAPPWDPAGMYRVALAGEKPLIQKLDATGSWMPSPLTPPEASEARRETGPNASPGIKVFISHASGDATLAKAMIALLEAGLTITDRAIRCTSVPGYRLQPGDVAPDVLRENLAECDVVIGLLTDTSMESHFVMMELGAAWGHSKVACLLLAPSLPFTTLPGPFGNVHAIKMDDEPGLMELLDAVAGHTGCDRTANTGKTTAAAQTFAQAARSLPKHPAQVAATYQQTDEATTSDQEAIIRIKGWGRELDRGGRVTYRQLDKELCLHGGLAEKCIERGLTDLYDIERGPESALLTLKPMTVSSSSYRARSIYDGGSDF